MTHCTSNVSTASQPSHEELTLVAPQHGSSTEGESQECCLVQIYPADVIDGMMLLEQGSLTVGRDPIHDLYLPDSSVSRRHAEFRQTESGYRLIDLGSTNGSWVNGERVTTRDLQSGDTVQLGYYMFRFLSAGSVESQYHETVYSAITRDVLTGAMNKRYLLEALEREMSRSRRQQTQLAVVMFDIDHFKRINDTHGHLAGDEVLREFGRRIIAVCRADDLMARYGGEEFSLVLCGSTREEALDMAERCRQTIGEKPFLTAVGELAITASFGVAVFDQETHLEPTDLLQAADRCLYAAKSDGRNCVCG